jgi:hypothetical protein
MMSQEIDEAIKDAEKRLENFDKDIRLLEWEANNVKLHAEIQARGIRDKAMQVVGEIAALKRIKAEMKTGDATV